MGFINSDSKTIGKYIDIKGNISYGNLGLYDTDTDLVEFFSLQLKKRIILSIDNIEIIKDEKEYKIVKILYGVK